MKYLIILLLIIFSCTPIEDTLSPNSLSEASFQGLILSSENSLPVNGVRVSLGAKQVYSDSLGVFLVTNVLTGNSELKLHHDSYLYRTIPITVKLSNKLKIYYLDIRNTFPEIDNFQLLPETTVSIDDTVKFYYICSDSTDSILDIVLKDFDSLIYQKPCNLFGYTDSIAVNFNESGKHNIILEVKDSYNTVVRETLTVFIGSNRKPKCKISDGNDFSAGERGTKFFTFSDPDSNLLVAYIDWDDTSKMITILNLEEGLTIEKSHIYENPGNYVISVEILDKLGATNYVKDSVIVIKLEKPDASGPVFTPASILGVDSFSVSLTIYSLNECLYQIDWVFNEGKPFRSGKYENFNEATCTVFDSGKTVTATFSTNILITGDNSLHITIWDAKRKTTDLYGSIHMY